MEKERYFVKLGWTLLEHRCRYYELDDPIIEDHEYDKLEKEYLDLAKELNISTNIENMVGFDKKLPSCQAVLHKLRNKTNTELV